MRDKFNKDFYTALAKIKAKVLSNELSYNNNEWLSLAYVTREINKVLFNRVRELKRGCSGQCVASAVKVIANFIKQTETEDNQESQSKVIRVKVNNKQPERMIDNSMKSPDDEVYQRPKLKELRAEHPHIKATSVDVFIQKLHKNK